MNLTRQRLRPQRAEIFSYRDPEQKGAFSSRALCSIFKVLENSDHKPRILDLGWPGSYTISFYSQFNPLLHLESLSREAWLIEQSVTSLKDLLTFPKNPNSIDVVMCWDILDYLNREQLTELGEILSLVCAPGAYLMALISTLVSMPKYPCCYQVTDNQAVAYGSPKDDERAAPRYTPNDLKRIFKQFEEERNVLLKNGVYELLLRKK